MLRRLFTRIREGFQRFMWGRYGVDQLNLFLLGAAVVVSLLGMILSRLLLIGPLAGLVTGLLVYGLLGWYIFRVLSRNLDARRRENRRFLSLFRGVRDRENRYYQCPRCRQTVRVPRGRGKIKITCPKCEEKFIRRS